MTPQVEQLDAIIVSAPTIESKRRKIEGLETIIKKSKRLSITDIVRLAITVIPNNLNDKPHSYIGYYRDYQFVEKEYYNLNEGILEQFDGGIKIHKRLDKTNHASFYSFKQNTEFKSSSYYSKAYNGINKYVENAQLPGFGGNELSILNVHKPIRNFDTNSFSYVYQLNKDFILNHEFSKSNTFFNDEEPVINITFKAKRLKRKGVYFLPITIENDLNSLKHNVSGNISISLIDYSILSFSYTMFDKNRDSPLFSIKIEYRKTRAKCISITFPLITDL